MNIGLIGVGTIGKFLLEKLNQGNVIPGYQITAVFDDRGKSEEKLDTLSQEFNFTVYNELDLFLQSPVDLVVECANIDVVKQYAGQIIHEKDLLLISVGALADPLLYKELHTIATLRNRKVYLPTGAIGGLDMLRAANVLDGLDAVTLETRKPVQALSIGAIEKETIIYEGSAKDAIVKFPENANIAIILSLAGIGVDETKVWIIADPLTDKNTHHLKARGDFGKLELKLENNPSPTNPKTSYLTALSILASLKSLDDVITIG